MRLPRAAARGVGRGARALAHRPLAAAAAACAIACGFALLAVTAVAGHNAAALTGAWTGEAGMIVYLDDDVDAARARSIGQALAALPAIRSATYVPPEHALDDLRGLFGAGTPAADALEPGMLPGSLDIALRDGVADVAAAAPLVARLEATPGVDEVVFAGDWVTRVHALARGTGRAAAVAWLLCAIACAYVVAAAVRLRLGAAPPGEPRAWAVAGATDWFVRGPRAVEGALLGAAGAALGALAGWLLFASARAPVAAALSEAFGAPAVELTWLPAGNILRMIALGAGIGLAAGLLVARRDSVHALA